MNINSNYSALPQNYSAGAGQDVSLPPELLAQLAAQNQTQTQAADYGLQGPGQDALLSISGTGNTAGTSSSGVDPQALGQQLEQQISGGDLTGALSTLQQLQAGRPQGGEKPPGADQIDSLEATLTQQLQNNDQEGAEETLAQIQSSMGQPSSSSSTQQSQQSQSVDQVAGLGQPTPLSNGQFPGAKGFQRTAPTSSQKQQILPPYQSLTSR
ncbi:hypothetical protein ABS71_03170 [bacterium SCN 62-11]|nr:hypothetical protein [Candidatus Eremiobacteraeota bacterium]ODT76715.1 MAG: hypothetical protein ABS71_03170 [bacterium SCN 62-11]